MNSSFTISFDTNLLLAAREKYGKDINKQINKLLRYDLEIKENKKVDSLSELDEELKLSKTRTLLIEVKKKELLAKIKKEEEDEDANHRRAYELNNEGGTPYHIAFPDKK